MPRFELFFCNTWLVFIVANTNPQLLQVFWSHCQWVLQIMALLCAQLKLALMSVHVFIQTNPALFTHNITNKDFVFKVVVASYQTSVPTASNSLSNCLYLYFSTCKMQKYTVLQGHTQKLPCFTNSKMSQLVTTIIRD